MPTPRIAIDGKLVDDVQFKFTETGTAMARLRIVATDMRKNDQTGKWEDGNQCYITATCWKDTAEHVAESLHKGDLVIVTGRLVTNEWKDRDGNQRSALTVNADSIGPSLRFRVTPHGAHDGTVERVTDPDPALDPWHTHPGPSAPPTPPERTMGPGGSPPPF